ncbi:MAG: TPM domain-containing protein [Halocynthiibacter sp.]
MIRIFSLIFILFSPVLSLAQAHQNLPSNEHAEIMDQADILSPATERALTETLDALKTRTGVELAIATFKTKRAFTDEALEPFATRLFNNWGIGDAEKNNGIMVLVLPEDREMRIELGRGYDQDKDLIAGDIIDWFMLPAFKKGDYETGITNGVDAIIERIVDGAPHQRPIQKTFGDWIPFILITLVGLFMVFRRRLSTVVTRMKRCPNCGRRSLQRIYEGPVDPELHHGTRRTYCDSCDYHDDTPYRTSSSTSSSGDSFGGGSSGGGGASGRW